MGRVLSFRFGTSIEQLDPPFVCVVEFNAEAITQGQLKSLVFVMEGLALDRVSPTTFAPTVFCTRIARPNFLSAIYVKRFSERGW